MSIPFDFLQTFKKKQFCGVQLLPKAATLDRGFKGTKKLKGLILEIVDV